MYMMNKLITKFLKNVIYYTFEKGILFKTTVCKTTSFNYNYDIYIRLIMINFK